MTDLLSICNIQEIVKTSPVCASLMSAVRPVIECCCMTVVNLEVEFQCKADALIKIQTRL